MKNIITSGTRNHETVCSGCGCHFQYDGADVDYYTTGDSMTAPEHHQTVSCPQCDYPCAHPVTVGGPTASVPA